MRYKLINNKTKEEHFCGKVIIDGFDYYVSDKCNDLGGWHIDKEFEILSNVSRFNVVAEMREVIATNNPTIDIPKVVIDETQLRDALFVLDGQKIYTAYMKDHNSETALAGFLRGCKHGYNKSQETHPFSEEDMIEFAEFVATYKDKNRNYLGQMLHAKSKYDGAERTIDLLELWKSEKDKIVFYE